LRRDGISHVSSIFSPQQRLICSLLHICVFPQHTVHMIMSFRSSQRFRMIISRTVTDNNNNCQHYPESYSNVHFEVLRVGVLQNANNSHNNSANMKLQRTNTRRHAVFSNGDEHVMHAFDPAMGWYCPAGHILQYDSKPTLYVFFGHTTANRTITKSKSTANVPTTNPRFFFLYTKPTGTGYNQYGRR
jgi:hypothetical protein